MLDLMSTVKRNEVVKLCNSGPGLLTYFNHANGVRQGSDKVCVIGMVRVANRLGC